MPADIMLGSVPGFKRRFFHLQQAFPPSTGGQTGDRGGFSCITPENHSFNLKIWVFLVTFVFSGKIWQLSSDEQRDSQYIQFGVSAAAGKY